MLLYQFFELLRWDKIIRVTVKCDFYSVYNFAEVEEAFCFCHVRPSVHVSVYNIFTLLNCYLSIYLSVTKY